VWWKGVTNVVHSSKLVMQCTPYISSQFCVDTVRKWHNKVKADNFKEGYKLRCIKWNKTVCILLVWFIIIKIGGFISELRAQINGIVLNALNTELNPVCHLLVLLGAHHILHVSRIRVNCTVNLNFIFSKSVWSTTYNTRSCRNGNLNWKVPWMCGSVSWNLKAIE